MNEFSAKFLIEHKEIWELIIPFSKYQFDEEWSKLIVHKVPTKPFECEEGIYLLKEEIESYNKDLNIELVRPPNWLSQEEARLQKNHSSIIIYLSNQNLANSLINSKIFIAGELCKVEKYIPKYIQCEKCQEFRHTKFRCKNDYKCLICAKNQNCIHLPIKCANCGLPHKANNKNCKEWQRVNPKNKNIDFMEIN